MNETLSAELSPPLRLAVAYAPRQARGLWSALLLLDQRLGRVALQASEPLLAQLKLAWWRDRFREPAARWPDGEPLLAALEPLDSERATLEAMVDGWERVIGGNPAPSDRRSLIEARAEAIGALARALEVAADVDAVMATARDWASADLAKALGERRDEHIRAAPLPRPLRPLDILARTARLDEGAGPLALFGIVRLGLFGR